MGKSSPSWCHFVQRVQRIQTQFVKRTKEKHVISKTTANFLPSSMLNYENEKFSYLIISKGDIKLTGATQEEKNKIHNEDERVEDWGRLIRYVYQLLR